MVTLIKYGALSGGEKYNVNVLNIDGLSTDTKPTVTYIEYGSDGREIGRMGIPNGSIFTEIDTGDTYMYDADNMTWYQVTIGGGGTGGTTNYNDLSNKPQINGNTLSGNKTGAQLGLASASDIPTTLAELTDDATHRVVTDTEKTAWNNKSNFSGSYNDLTDKPTIPDELSDLTEDATHRTVSDTEKATWNAKADTADIPTVPVKGIEKNGTAITPDASGVVNITVPTTAADVSALPATTLYGASISLSINTTTFVVTVVLKDQNGDTLGTAQTIDLPLESVVVNGSYNSATKKVVLTLQSGSTVEFSVADLVAGLQSEITSTNKLDADLVDDSTSINKFVSSAEKTAWNDKQSAITNSNKLSSDLVDDTNSTHKFATAAQLAQIATNASDISDIQTTIGNINTVLEGVL